MATRLFETSATSCLCGATSRSGFSNSTPSIWRSSFTASVPRSAILGSSLRVGFNASRCLQPRLTNGGARADAGAVVSSPRAPKEKPSDARQQLTVCVQRLCGQQAPPLSDIVWSALGAFIGMATLLYMDATFFAKRGLQMTIGSFAAVCVLLFAAPKAPVSQKWNVYVGHMGCALIGLLALTIFGPGWIARCTAVAASVAFMQFTGSLHPPAGGVALLFIDSPKMQALQWWYILFPGVIGAVVLFAIAAAVDRLREKVKF